MDLWDKVWRDKHGKVVVWQTPNVWLIAWAVIDVVSVLTTGSVSNVFWWIGTIDLGVWALLEIFLGVNYFRKALGVLVFLLVIATSFKLGL
jgi:uncharacterized membrane protein